MSRRKRINLSLLLALLAFLSMFTGAMRQVREQQAEYNAAQSEYDELRDNFGTICPEVGVPNPAPGADIESSVTLVNFDALFAINPNVVGWLVLPNSSINYPIVQGTDNRHYLRHTFRGQRNANGAIFLDYRDTPDFNSRAKVYGHNMRNNAMFGTLSRWTGERFYVHTPYEVIAFAVTWRGVLSLADIVAIDDGAALITCVNGRPNVRFVVRAVRL